MLLPPGPLTTLIALPQGQGSARVAKGGVLRAAGKPATRNGTDVTVTTGTDSGHLKLALGGRFHAIDQAAGRAGLGPATT